MALILEKVEESEVLIADFGSVKLYRVIESNENSELESISESES